jgi:hypothetical protein
MCVFFSLFEKQDSEASVQKCQIALHYSINKVVLVLMPAPRLCEI